MQKGRFYVKFNLKNDPTMDNRYSESSKTWNKVAALYQDKFMDLDLYNGTYDFICSSLI